MFLRLRYAGLLFLPPRFSSQGSHIGLILSQGTQRSSSPMRVCSILLRTVGHRDGELRVAQTAGCPNVSHAHLPQCHGLDLPIVRLVIPYVQLGVTSVAPGGGVLFYLAMSRSAVVKLVPGRTILFVCDIQTRFRTAIHGFDEMVTTVHKILKVAEVSKVPVVATEQNPRALGPTISELDFVSLGPLFLGTVEKTLFSMATPEVIKLLQDHNMQSVILLGIESHVCVLQSTLDLLSLGYDVHVVADGVSSCNKEEVPFALARMLGAGAQITTSESVAFQLQLDSSRPNFKAFSAVIKEEKERTAQTLQTLLPLKSTL